MRTARGAKQGAWATPLAIVLIALALSLVAASTAAAARSEFFGISQKEQLDDRDFQGMAAARVRTDRFGLDWRAVEKTRGSFTWGWADQLVGDLAAHRIRSFPLVWASPTWVASKPSLPPTVSGDEQAWRNFLKAAVARYGPGGSYWADDYRQQHPGAAPLPIHSWQVWNEPNLEKYFDPGGTDSKLAQKYARLLRISHDAIKSEDPQAQIVLAGMPGYPPRGGPRAWDFLERLYRVPGIQSAFDAAALHPYARTMSDFRFQIQKARAVMVNHRDRHTPLWLTEVGWGSGPPDRWERNVGPIGQRRMLSNSFSTVLNHRRTWNVQRLFWFLWRDPAPGSQFARRCSFCGTGGLLRHNRSRKPAYSAFRGYTAETTPPQASISSGPSHGSLINDSTPTFTFASNDPSAIFQCHIDAQTFSPCTSPFTRASPLPDGTHTLFVKAIDAAGNESQVRSRSFTVDATAPATTITSGPAEGSNSADPNPTFSFESNDSGAGFRCQLDSGGFAPCSSPYAASQLARGLHRFQVRAVDEAGNVGAAATRTWTIGLVITSGPASGSLTNDPTPSFSFSSPDSSTVSCGIDGVVVDADCTSPFTSSRLSDGDHTFKVEQGTDIVSRDFTVDTAAPAVTMSSGPANGAATNDPTPTFQFSSSESGATFQCRYEGEGFSACSGARSDTPASPLSDGPQTFHLKAIDAANNKRVLSRSFAVDTVAPELTIEGPGKTKTKSRRGARVTFRLSASEQVNRRCRVDSRRFRSCSWRYRTPMLTPGIHRLKVKATDRAGNVGAKRKRFKIVRSRPRGRSQTRKLGTRGSVELVHYASARA